MEFLLAGWAVLFAILIKHIFVVVRDKCRVLADEVEYQKKWNAMIESYPDGYFINHQTAEIVDKNTMDRRCWSQFGIE